MISIVILIVVLLPIFLFSFVCTFDDFKPNQHTKWYKSMESYATTDVFIFRRITKDAWLCNIKIDPSITT